jgi:hypothetical protein
MTGPRYSVAIGRGVALRDGKYVVISPGDELLSTDPIVRSNPHLFEPRTVAGVPPVKRAERRKKA